jgi:hypothetical protein
MGRDGTGERRRRPAGDLPDVALARRGGSRRLLLPHPLHERSAHRRGAGDVRAAAHGHRTNLSPTARCPGRGRWESVHGQHQLSHLRRGDPASTPGEGQELPTRTTDAGAVPAEPVLRGMALLVESDPVLDRFDAGAAVALSEAEIPLRHVPRAFSQGLGLRLARTRRPYLVTDTRQLRGVRDRPRRRRHRTAEAQMWILALLLLLGDSTASAWPRASARSTVRCVSCSAPRHTREEYRRAMWTSCALACRHLRSTG